jgi:hypothetical protein
MVVHPFRDHRIGNRLLVVEETGGWRVGLSEHRACEEEERRRR